MAELPVNVYTHCIDSASRDKRCDAEPNNFKAHLSGGQHIRSKRISLAGFEMPVTQQLIEDDWSKLYLHEGYKLSSSNNSFPIDDDGTTKTIGIPQNLNKIDTIECSGGATPTYTIKLVLS